MSNCFTHDRWSVIFASGLTALAACFPVSATAGTIVYTDIAASAFVGHNSSYHNDGQAPDACAAQVPLDVGSENRGDLQNAAGSFIANVILPPGSTIKKFTLFANDADGDINSSAYLVRKNISNNLKPAKSNIATLAQVSTSGAVIDTMRAFSTTTIAAPVVANGASQQYFVELISCGKTVEPFSVQIVVSTP